MDLFTYVCTHDLVDNEADAKCCLPVGNRSVSILVSMICSKHETIMKEFPNFYVNSIVTSKNQALYIL